MAGGRLVGGERERVSSPDKKEIGRRRRKEGEDHVDGTTSQKREKEDCVPYFPTKALIYRFSPSPTRFLYRGYLTLRGKSSWEAKRE